MLKAFKACFNFSSYPGFDKDNEYFMIRKGNKKHEEVSDAWDAFRIGWEARESVDEHTVSGW
jgi:hypothetical protein